MKNKPGKKRKEAAVKAWRSRIVGEGEREAKDFVPHELNWRTHSKTQKSALAELLGEIGWVQRIIVSRRSGKILDGHARVEEALSRSPETPVPFVEVDLSEAEELKVLALLDPIGSLAGTDADRLDELTGLLDLKQGSALQEVLSGINGTIPEELTGAATPNLNDSNFNYESQYGVIVECESEIHQKAVFDRLAAEGLKVRVVVV